MAEDLEEASNELIITDDDAVQYSVGETFVAVDNDTAETMLEKAADDVRSIHWSPYDRVGVVNADP